MASNQNRDTRPHPEACRPRHGHPLDLWIHFVSLPAAVLTFWTRKWIGAWCLAPGLLIFIWAHLYPIFLNRRISPPNWAARAMLGERIFLNRDKVEIPAAHNLPLHALLALIASTGVILIIWSVVFYSVWGVVLGLAMAGFGRGWFLDRMVWLYEDIRKEHEIFED